MYNETNCSMGSGWRERIAANERRKADAADPELLARRAESQARIEAERAEQMRLAAEAQARIEAEYVQFPPMPVKMAAEVVMAFERFRSAGREATAAEIETVSRMVQGLNPCPGSPVIRLTYGLSLPVPVSGVAVPFNSTVSPQGPSIPLDNAPKAVLPTKANNAKPGRLLDAQYLIED